MEDRDPSGTKLTWGPHVFSHDQLWEKTLALDLTCRALLAALTMFDVNNHFIFQARGYLPRRERAIRADAAEALMRMNAELLGFQLKGWQEELAGVLRINLKISGYREYGPSEIVAGSQDGKAARYLMDVRTEETPLSRQVYSLLQLTLDLHDSRESLIVEVCHEDGTPAGTLKTSRAARQKIFEATMVFEEVRRIADEDTLSDSTMPVVVRGVPRRL